MKEMPNYLLVQYSNSIEHLLAEEMLIQYDVNAMVHLKPGAVRKKLNSLFKKAEPKLEKEKKNKEYLSSEEAARQLFKVLNG